MAAQRVQHYLDIHKIGPLFEVNYFFRFYVKIKQNS